MTLRYKTIGFNRIKFVVLVCTIFGMFGCAIRPVDVSQSEINQGKLGSLTNWQVSGKLAILRPDERKSANLSWRQTNAQIDMRLSTVVGSSIANLSFKDGKARLQADGQTWDDASASRLIYRVTGWQIPVEQLSRWMKGDVQPQLVQTRFDNGLVKEFTAKCESCTPWKIQYTTYGEFTVDDVSYVLPTAMRLAHIQSNTQLVLRLDQWK